MKRLPEILARLGTLLVPAVALIGCGIILSAFAAEKPPLPVPSPRALGSDVGRYQIVVTGQPYPMVLKLDSATGACWEYQAGEVDNKHLNRKFTAHGWIPVPEDFSIELKRTMDVGKP